MSVQDLVFSSDFTTQQVAWIRQSLREKPPWECCFQHLTPSSNRSQRPLVWVCVVIGCSPTVLVPWCLQAEIVQSNFVMKNYNKTVGSASCKKYLVCGFVQDKLSGLNIETVFFCQELWKKMHLSWCLLAVHLVCHSLTYLNSKCSS